MLAGVKRDENGIWKAAVPPGGMHGEFANHDPVGLMSGALIKTDCSMNWTDPDSRKLFCFTTGTSLVYFLQWPKTNIERAQRFWNERQSREQAQAPIN